MNSRIPLIVAVVGALLIGGATTGSTRASWSEQVPMAGHAVTSAKNMVFTTSASPARQTLTQGSGFITAQVTLADTSELALNLRQAHSVSSVTSTLAGIRVSVTSSCPSSAPTTAVSGYTTGTLFTTKPAAVDETGTLCIALAAAAPGDTGTGTVTVNFKGTQVRPNGASINGWTSTGSFAVPVTVNAPGAAGPAGLTCTGSNVASATLAWSTPTAGTPTGYEVYVVSPEASIKFAGGTTTTINNGELPGNGAVVIGVRAIYAGGVTSTSNPTVSMSQNNGGGPGGRVGCGAVTP